MRLNHKFQSQTRLSKYTPAVNLSRVAPVYTVPHVACEANVTPVTASRSTLPKTCTFACNTRYTSQWKSSAEAIMPGIRASDVFHKRNGMA